MVSIHWGEEYKDTPPKRSIEIAHQLFEAGADVILGHHPHVLQPLEVYQAEDGRRCFVAYSLGNFISNQSRLYIYNVSPDRMGDTRDGAILYFSVQKRDYGAGVVRYELARLHFIPIWTENDTLTHKGKSPSRIRVVSMDRALKRVRSEIIHMLEGKGDPPVLSAVEELQYLELSRYLETLEERRKIVAARLGEDYAVPEDAVLLSQVKHPPMRIPVDSSTKP